MRDYCKYCDKEVSNIFSHRQSKKHKANVPKGVVEGGRKKPLLSEKQKKKNHLKSMKKYYYSKQRGEKYECEHCKIEIYEGNRDEHENSKAHQNNKIINRLADLIPNEVVRRILKGE
jgi:hypothetical protein